MRTTQCEGDLGCLEGKGESGQGVVIESEEAPVRKGGKKGVYKERRGGGKRVCPRRIYRSNYSCISRLERRNS